MDWNRPSEVSQAVAVGRSHKRRFELALEYLIDDGLGEAALPNARHAACQLASVSSSSGLNYLSSQVSIPPVLMFQ